ncbi:MAG: hypothetical protein KF727_11440 [Microbacteriaceae bacterium]|nr:hypothetical protein [Microbacteriaceae bacterium]
MSPHRSAVPTIMLRSYLLQPAGADEFLAWWRPRIPPLRERYGFRIEFAHLDREHDRFVWALSYPGSRAAFEAADAVYSADPDRAAAMALAPPLRDSVVGFIEPVL